MSDTRELRLFWVQAEDGEVWIAGVESHPEELNLTLSRQDAHERAAEYDGRLAEQRIVVPVPDFTDLPLARARVLDDPD